MPTLKRRLSFQRWTCRPLLGALIVPLLDTFIEKPFSVLTLSCIPAPQPMESALCFEIINCCKGWAADVPSPYHPMRGIQMTRKGYKRQPGRTGWWKQRSLLSLPR